MDPLLTVDDLATYYKVKPRTIYQWVHEGYLPVVKLGSAVRFKQASIAEWVKKRETPGRAKQRVEFDAH